MDDAACIQPAGLLKMSLSPSVHSQERLTLPKVGHHHPSLLFTTTACVEMFTLSCNGNAQGFVAQHAILSPYLRPRQAPDTQGCASYFLLAHARAYHWRISYQIGLCLGKKALVKGGHSFVRRSARPPVASLLKAARARPRSANPRAVHARTCACESTPKPQN